MTNKRRGAYAPQKRRGPRGRKAVGHGVRDPQDCPPLDLGSLVHRPLVIIVTIDLKQFVPIRLPEFNLLF